MISSEGFNRNTFKYSAFMQVYKKSTNLSVELIKKNTMVQFEQNTTYYFYSSPDHRFLIFPAGNGKAEENSKDQVSGAGQINTTARYFCVF